MNQCIGYNSIIKNNGTTITYAYNVVDDTGNVTKSNVQESFVMLPTDTDLNNANNTILKAINERLNPVTETVLGSIVVNYVDSNNNKIADSLTQTNLQLSTYFFTAPTINGYNLSGNIMQSITLDATTPNQSVTFVYTPIVKGNITIKYLDDSNAEIATADSYTNLDLGNYTYQAKTVDGYTLTDSTQSSQTITISATNTNVTITFNYKKNVITNTNN